MWIEIMEMYNLGENSRLQRIYAIREIISCDQSQDTTLLDPSVAAIKGRPRSLRMKVYVLLGSTRGAIYASLSIIAKIDICLTRSLREHIQMTWFRNHGKEEVILVCIQKQNYHSFIDHHIRASHVQADDMNDLARLVD
ncbi:hypothetical protein RDI58_011247 [Solanum bulbocastanum]|uniref:Uncharacterized protein n=1 Tax=Solanum bulbocastanum TaxID=147425 RepID=A0AAN8TVF2_SOLBU